MALGIPDYHDIVRQPADLGTIRVRLAHGAAEVCASTTLVSGERGSDSTQVYMTWEAKGFLGASGACRRNGQPHAGPVPAAQPGVLEPRTLLMQCAAAHMHCAAPDGCWVAQKGVSRRGGRHRGTWSLRMCWTR